MTVVASPVLERRLRREISGEILFDAFSRGRYATDSLRTAAVRTLAPHFEHKLFLSATPHNGYRESFTALLEFGPNPIPIPATMALFLTGLIGFIIMRRRKKG